MKPTLDLFLEVKSELKDTLEEFRAISCAKDYLDKYANKVREAVKKELIAEEWSTPIIHFP